MEIGQEDISHVGYFLRESQKEFFLQALSLEMNGTFEWRRFELREISTGVSTLITRLLKGKWPKTMENGVARPCPGCYLHGSDSYVIWFYLLI